MGAVAMVLLVAVSGTLFLSMLGEREARNESLRAAIEALDSRRDELTAGRQMAAQLEARIGASSVALASIVEQAARASNVQIVESTERDPVARGKAYLERAVELKLRGVALDAVAELLRRLETSEHLIFVERLEVRPRYNQHEQLDVEVAVVSLERRPRPTKGGAAPAGGVQ
jgi:Tfp pilus assembly protein PilN